MKVGQVLLDGAVHLAVRVGEQVLLPARTSHWPSSVNTVAELLLAPQHQMQELTRLARRPPASALFPLSGLRLLAPLHNPPKNVMCLGWNYAEHAAESAKVQNRTEPNVPTDPIVFTKAHTTITGPFDDIPYPKGVTTQWDWEVELGVVIGSGGREIAVDAALNHVFGYVVINDLSARDLQFRHKQYFLGKSLDGACPMGPWITTADEVPDPQQLKLWCRVNGVEKQCSSTSLQIFSVAQIIATLSRGMTLEPGDLIATGTPAGVGFARTPPEFLNPGDTVECEIEMVGLIRNRIVG